MTRAETPGQELGTAELGLEGDAWELLPLHLLDPKDFPAPPSVPSLGLGAFTAFCHQPLQHVTGCSRVFKLGHKPAAQSTGG